MKGYYRMKVDATMGEIKDFAKQQKGKVTQGKAVETALKKNVRRQVKRNVDTGEKVIAWGTAAPDVGSGIGIPPSLQNSAGMYTIPPILPQQPNFVDGEVVTNELEQQEQELTKRLQIIQQAKQDALRRLSSASSESVKRQPRSRCMCAAGCPQGDCLYFDRQGYQPVNEMVQKLIRISITKDSHVTSALDKVIEEKVRVAIDKVLSKYS